ncbi:hypothetical protein GCM10022221_76830 [Actinocorallia aurea]
MARPSQYPPELWQRAVRMVAEVRPDYPNESAALAAVAQKLGIGSRETLRNRVRQAEVDTGKRPGTTTEEAAQVKALKKEIAELRRAKEILKAAASFFAAELDRPHTRSWRSSTSTGTASAVLSRSAACSPCTTARSPLPPTTPSTSAKPRPRHEPCATASSRR